MVSLGAVLAVAAGVAVAFFPLYAVIGLAALAFLAASWAWPRQVFVLLLLARFASDYLTDPTAESQSPSTVVITAATFVFAGVVLVRWTGKFLDVPAAPVMLFALLVLYVALRSTPPESAGQGLRETGQWATYLVSFVLALVLFGDEAGMTTIARVVVGGALFESALSAFQLATGQVPAYFTAGQTYLRPYGTFPHPGWLAYFLAFALLVLPATRWARRWQVAAGAVILLFLVLTFSRGALVFLVVAVLIYGALLRRLRVLVAVVVGSLVALTVPVIHTRFLGELVNGQEVGSYESRALLRAYAFEKWQESPIFGNGSGSFFGYFSRIRFNEPIEAHSDVAKLLADQGVVGLGLYLLAVIIPLWMIARTRRREYMPAAALLAVLPVMGYLDVLYRLNTDQVMLWSFVGATLGAAVSSWHAREAEGAVTPELASARPAAGGGVTAG